MRFVPDCVRVVATLIILMFGLSVFNVVYSRLSMPLPARDAHLPLFRSSFAYRPLLS